jgi:hypothetical protein
LREGYRECLTAWKNTSRGVKVMAKVGRAFTLDMETIKLIEVYTHSGETSRSALVNEAIKWYIRGDFVELMEDHKKLKENYQRVCNELYGVHDKQVSKSWWRRLLGL